MYYYSLSLPNKLLVKFTISNLRNPEYLAVLAGVQPAPNNPPNSQSQRPVSPPPSPILSPRRASSPVQRRDNQRPSSQSDHERTILSNLDQSSAYYSAPRNPTSHPVQLSKFRVFSRRKRELEDDLRELESRLDNPSDTQPDSIKSQGLDLRTRLLNLKISEWVYSDFSSCPEVERDLDPEAILEWEDMLSRI